MSDIVAAKLFNALSGNKCEKLHFRVCIGRSKSDPSICISHDFRCDANRCSWSTWVPKIGVRNFEPPFAEASDISSLSTPQWPGAQSITTVLNLESWFLEPFLRWLGKTLSKFLRYPCKLRYTCHLILCLLPSLSLLGLYILQPRNRCSKEERKSSIPVFICSVCKTIPY